MSMSLIRSNRMSNKPSAVLVHGFWGGAAHWAKVIVELNGRGHGSLHAVENPLTSLSDDAERTRKMVKQVDGPVSGPESRRVAQAARSYTRCSPPRTGRDRIGPTRARTAGVGVSRDNVRCGRSSL